MFALIVPNEGVQSGVDTLTPRENAQGLPGSFRFHRASSTRRRACERRAAAAGWQVPAEPTMPRLNSQVL